MIQLLYRIRKLYFRYTRRRTLGAHVIAVDDAGKVLLVRQNYGSGLWTMPGGGLKHRESFQDAAIREAREEAGIHPAEGFSCDLLGLYLKRQGMWTDHIAVFVLRGWRQEPQDTWEIAEARLFDPADLPDQLSPAVGRRIAEWRGDQPIHPMW